MYFVINIRSYFHMIFFLFFSFSILWDFFWNKIGYALSSKYSCYQLKCGFCKKSFIMNDILQNPHFSSFYKQQFVVWKEDFDSFSLFWFRVQILWEGHKILRNLSLTFDCMYYSQTRLICCLVTLELWLPDMYSFVVFLLWQKTNLSVLKRNLFHFSTLHTYHHNSSCSFR